jgi:hypothetical protein
MKDQWRLVVRWHANGEAILGLVLQHYGPDFKWHTLPTISFDDLIPEAQQEIRDNAQ